MREGEGDEHDVDTTGPDADLRSDHRVGRNLSLTYAAGFGALNLAMSVPLGDGVSISYAAMDLSLIHI